MYFRRYFVTWLLLCLFVQGFSRAEVLSGDNVPGALRDIPRARLMCSSNEIAGAGSTPMATGAEYPDLGCGISVSEAIPFLKGQGTVIVDTRTPNEFGEFQIEGAINLSASGLRHKTYLRSSSVLLVGNGKGERVLYEACSRLRKDGFSKIRVLSGGMPSWLLSGQPIVGKPSTPHTLVELSPEELWAESSFDANRILVEKKMQAIQGYLSRSRTISDDSNETIVATLSLANNKGKSLRAGGRREVSLASVIMVLGDGKSFEQIHDLRQAIKPTPLLVYRNTTEAFERYVSAQKTVWAAQSRGPKQPKCGL